MFNPDKFTPVSVDNHNAKRKGGGEGALTIINTQNNGKRLMLSEKLVKTLEIEGDKKLQVGFVEKALVLGKKLPGSGSQFELKRLGKKYVIYCAELIRQISNIQGLSFEKGVSYTWYSPSVDEYEGNPIVIFEPEGGENGAE